MKYEQHSSPPPEGLIPATLAHLVTGQTLFLSDPRRTPVVIARVDTATASFAVRVLAFEDAGASWDLPLWDVSKFLTDPQADRLTHLQQTALQNRASALRQHTAIAVQTQDRTRSQQDIAAALQDARAWLARAHPNLPADAGALLNSTEANPDWSAACAGFLRHKGVQSMDLAFATQYASNPHASEVIKGHRIVLAQMGLCPYQGDILRDPEALQGKWSRSARRAHIVARLGFMAAMLEQLELAALPLYRVVCSDTRLTPPRNTGFVSASFSRDVALSLFTAGQTTRSAALYWQSVPGTRLFLSFLETPALSRKFQEAEAVLLFDPTARPF